MDTCPCPTCNLPFPPADLPIHKILCAQFSSLPPKPSTSPDYILGFLFPSSSSSTPTPVWMPLTTTTDDLTSITFQSVDTTSIFSPSSPDVLYTERNTLRDRDTRSMLEIWTHPASRTEGDENATIAALAADDSREGKGPFHPWTGPVLALCMTRATGFMVDPGMYRDVTLEDAGDVVDFLLDYGNPEHGRRIREALDMLGVEKLDEGRIGGGDGKVEEGMGDGEGTRDGEQKRNGEQTRDVVFEVM